MSQGYTQEVAIELATDPAHAVDVLTTETRRALLDQVDAMRAAAQAGIGDPILAAIYSPEQIASVRQAAYDSQVAYAAGLMDGQNLPQVAFDAAMKLIDEEMTAAEESAQLHGQLVTLNHALGVASKEGKVASVNAINAAISVIEARMIELNADAYGYGAGFVSSYAWGIVNSLGLIHDAGQQLGGALGNQVAINSEPEASDSPLRGITQWGGNIVKTIADGIYGELGTGSAAAGALAGALVPSLAGGSGLGLGMGGTSVQYVLNVEGKPKSVGSRDDVIDAWLQMSFGDRSMTR